MGIFHTDPKGEPKTLHGFIHLAAALSSVVFFMLACFLTGLGLRREYKVLSVYSMLVVVFGMLVFAGREAPDHWKYIGLRERLGGTDAAVWTAAMSLAVITGKISGRKNRDTGGGSLV